METPDDGNNNDIKEVIPQEQIDIDSNNNKSDDEDIMNKLNEEADKIDSNINNDNIKLFSKYENLSEEELRAAIKSKNEALIKLNDEKEQSKTELNTLIKKLNEIIASNADILYHKEPDPIVINQLERIVAIRKRDLDMAKKTNQTFKAQCEMVSSKANGKLSTERLSGIEGKIDKIKKQNAEMIIKIRELKDKSNIQSKELEECSANKKYPHKIIACTEEIKSLTSKKHDYHMKLARNQRSLDNTMKEMKKLELLYNANIKEDSNEAIVSKINEWIELIKSDLSGEKEDILRRVDENNSKVLNAIDKERQKSRDQMKNELPMIQASERARSSSPETHRGNRNMNYNSVAIPQNKKRVYQGVFNKYSFLKKETARNKKLPRYMLSKGSPQKEEIKKVDNELIIEKDYENTTDSEYQELLNKREQLMTINTRLERSIKEYEKMSERKLKDISLTISQNSEKLNQLLEQNRLLKNEIANLTKILELTMEQNKLKKEIKQNESKFIKTINPPQQHTYNDPSVTGNDILQELNGLKDEDDKKRSINPTASNIIEEEQDNNKVLGGIESNKNIKCKVYIYNI